MVGPMIRQRMPPASDVSVSPTSKPFPGSDLTALVEAATRGDARAFAALVARFDDLVFSVALGITHQREDAADVAQQTWLVLLSKIGTVQSGDALPGWLSTTARREALRVVRQRSRNVPLDGNALERLTDPADGPDHHAERRDLAQRVNQALHRLPRQRAAFLVQLVGHERPYVEVAAQFQLSPGSVGRVRARYLRELSEALVDFGLAT
jgi:RNA polymerase sigma factor (sigma-70 family)